MPKKRVRKLGGERRVSFEGEVPIAATADMREIEDARSSGPLIDQQATPLPPIVVVLTVNENETQAVLDAFLGEGRQSVPAHNYGRTYRRARRNRHVPASSTRSARWAGFQAFERAQHAIADWHPDAVFAVGVAFGVDRKRQAPW